MAAVGGPLEAVGMAGVTYPVADDSESPTSIGGDSNEVARNGDGSTARLIKSRMSWKLESVKLSVDQALDDVENIQDLADRQDFFPITVSYIDGTIRQGLGQITGEIVYDHATSTLTVSLSGPGQLTKQS